MTSGTVVAANWHVFLLPMEVGAPKGRDLTSFGSIRTDVIDAESRWHDEAVVIGEGIVSSRNPGHLDAFSAKIIEEIAVGRHEARTLVA